MSNQYLYTCTDRTCFSKNDTFDDLGDVLEHVRSSHDGHRFFKRPHALGVADSHGHLWICHICEDRKTYKDHRSFNSHLAMWQHQSDRHDECWDEISCTKTSVANTNAVEGSWLEYDHASQYL